MSPFRATATSAGWLNGARSAGRPGRANVGTPARRRGGGGLAPGRVDDDAIVVVGRYHADELVEDVPQDAGGIALERIAPATAARQLVAIDVAARDRHRDLGRHHAMLGVRVDDVDRRPPGTSAVEPERPEGPSIGADLQHRLVLDEAVIAPEAHATAEFPGAARIGNELQGEDLERMLDLD